MSKNRKRIFKVFFAWQEEKEAAWLEEMAEKGWLMEKYHMIFYTFVQGQPEKYIYKFDYRDTNRDTTEYLEIFQDSGWEYVDRYLNWYYFRKKDDGTQLSDIYTDSRSEVQKYKALFRTFLILGIVNLFNLINITFNTSNTLSHQGELTFYNILRLLVLAAFVLVGYACFKTYRRIQGLKSDL
jgi:hypothetical protein